MNARHLFKHPKSILQLMGVNRAVGFGVLTKLWGALAGPVTLVLIATRVGPIEQGYYYTFGSVLALQVFFELGLLTVLAQFAAHEFMRLGWGGKGEVLGEAAYRDRFFDLLGKALRWYGVSSVLLAVVLIPGGLVFFGDAPPVDFSWRLPWVLAVVSVALNLLLIPFYAVVSGSGDVAFNNRRELLGGITGALLGWLVIWQGGGLYAVAAIAAGNLVVGTAYLARERPLLVQAGLTFALGRRRAAHTISWRGQVWPMQWKIAVSWIAGYFIFQLFTPLLFTYHGPTIAGQMGMTLSAINSVQGVCLMWLHSRSPEFGKLIAVKNWTALDANFRQVLTQAAGVGVAASFVAVAIVMFLQSYTALGARFLPASQVALFLVAVCANIFVSGWSIYMRAHKQEPMLVISIMGAVLVAGCTYFLGTRYSSGGMAVGYCLVTLLFTLPLTYLCLQKFKAKYHANNFVEL